MPASVTDRLDVAMRCLPRILPFAGLALLAAALPATAAARLTVAPPGDSAISQYAEVVPTGAGASPPRAGGQGGGAGGHGGVLTASQSRRLNALGPDGRTLAAVVDATAPQSLGVPVLGAPVPSRSATRLANPHGRAAGAASAGAGRYGTGGRAAGTASAGAGRYGTATGSGAAANLPFAPPSSPASRLVDAATGGGGGGLGVLLPALMLASAVGVTLLAVRRRRTSQ
jgi:hypothetical protein